MAFHTRDDWMWKRLPEGGVQVYNDRLGVQHKLTDAEWASVVASVSAGGETSERYQAALDFHNSP